MALTSGTKLRRYQVQFPVGARDALLVDWTPDDRYLPLNEKLTQALRTGYLIFPFFDERKPSQAAAVSPDAR
ncbi:MAG: hypothetical protein WA182_18735 [Candidatus Sulfotelmatobacter sp.]